MIRNLSSLLSILLISACSMVIALPVEDTSGGANSPNSLSIMILNDTVGSSRTIDEVIQAVKINEERVASENSVLRDTLMQLDDDTVLLELDIRMRKSDLQMLGTLRGRSKRAATIIFPRWPEKTVPYTIDPAAGFTTDDLLLISSVMEDYRRYTCVNWRPKIVGEDNSVQFTSAGGCWSYIGLIPSFESQTLSLSNGCRQRGIIAHEMMHALGAFHEHTRPDRDDFVTINFDNVADNLVSNFEKDRENEVTTYNVPYDYESVMHYGAFAFAKDGSVPTIVAKDSSMQAKMGNRDGLNFHDIELINQMYSCAANCQQANCPSEGFMDKDCVCQCPTGDPENPIEPCPVTPPVEELRACRDSTDNTLTCEGWAALGHCTNGKHYIFMAENCANTCFCQQPVLASCVAVDNNTACPVWASKGFCQIARYKQYMYDHCKKSCNSCCSCL